MLTIDAETYRRVRRTMLRQYPHDGEDLLQEALVSYSRLAEAPRSPERWLARRVALRSSSAWRSWWRQARAAGRFCEEQHVAPAPPDDRVLATQLLAAMPPARRRWLLDAVVGNEPAGIPAGTRRARRHFFRQSLAAAQAA